MPAACNFHAMKIPTPHRISASSDPFPRRPAPQQGVRDWARACIGVSRGIASPRANMPFPMPRHDHQVYLEDFDFEANRWNGEPSPAAIERLKEQGATANTGERCVLGVARKPEIEIRLPAAPRNASELRRMTQEDKQALREELTRNQDLFVDKWAEDRGVKSFSAVVCASLILKKLCDASLHDDREAYGSTRNANQTTR